MKFGWNSNLNWSTFKLDLAQLWMDCALDIDRIQIEFKYIYIYWVRYKLDLDVGRC